MVNGFAFLLCNEFVTHMTGTITRVGLEWQTIHLMLEYVTIVCCFVFGAAISIIAISSSPFSKMLSLWTAPLILVVLVLSGVALLGRIGVFGTFHAIRSHETPEVFLLSFLAFAMGVQNAAITSTTGVAVRTTHLSGHATNFGIHLGTAFLSQGNARRSALSGALLRGGKILAFGFGAVLAVPLTTKWEFLALLVPATLILIATLLGASAPPSLRTDHQAG